MPRNYLLKTWKMGVLIHGSCALVPCWLRIVSAVLTSWNFQVCLGTKVVASSGRHISEENVGDLQRSLVRAVTGYSCAQLLAAAMAAWS